MHGPPRFDIVEQRLGLGWARLGFVLGAGTEAAHLIRSAFERGIRFFDTANIYGRGERERILVSALQKRRIERL